MSTRTRTLAVAAAVFAAALAATVAIGWNVSRGADTQPPPAPVTSPPAAAPTAGYDPNAGDAADEQHEGGPPEVQEAAWGPVVDNFAANFTNTSGGPAKWRQRLIGDPTQPHVTTEVADQLGTVDLRNVPAGHYDSRAIVQSSAYDLAVKVDYREGWAMVLYLITDGRGWQIYAYDQWEE